MGRGDIRGDHQGEPFDVAVVYEGVQLLGSPVRQLLRAQVIQDEKGSVQIPAEYCLKAGLPQLKGLESRCSLLEF